MTPSRVRRLMVGLRTSDPADRQEDARPLAMKPALRRQFARDPFEEWSRPGRGDIDCRDGSPSGWRGSQSSEIDQQAEMPT